MDLQKQLRQAAFLLALAVVSVCSSPLNAEDRHYQSILNLMSKDKDVRKAASESLLQLKDASYVPAMVDTLFYMPRAFRSELIDLMRQTTGEKVGDSYYDWVEYVGRRQDLKSPPGYTRFKAALLSLIDPTYKKFFYAGVPLRIRPEEIVWGGVKLDGIPPIDAPSFISAEEARLKDDEKVFGLKHRGESRAYPLRYLSWHEMLNDRIGGEPVTISY